MGKRRRSGSREKRRRDSEAGPLRASAVRPPLFAIFAVVALATTAWVASLSAIFNAILDGRAPGILILVLIADLIATPLLFLFWTVAVVAPLQLTPTSEDGTFALAYYLTGKQGGAWLKVVRPRLLFRTPRTLTVMTRFGPRLLPRFVRLDGTPRKDEYELTLTDEGVRLAAAGSPL